MKEEDSFLTIQSACFVLVTKFPIEIDAQGEVVFVGGGRVNVCVGDGEVLVEMDSVSFGKLSELNLPICLKCGIIILGNFIRLNDQN